MATFTQLKNYVGRLIGESDGSGTDSTRDDLINDAIKEIATRYPFSCNKKSTTLTLSSNVATMPTDIDYSHLGEIAVYNYSATTSGSTKYTYTPVPFDDVISYSTGSYVYTIDQENSQIKSNQSDGSITMDYFAVPADLSGTDSTKFPIPMAIAYQAAGQYWQSIEEDPDQARINFQRADEAIQKAITRDKIGKPPRGLKSVYDDNEFLSTDSILACER